MRDWQREMDTQLGFYDLQRFPLSAWSTIIRKYCTPVSDHNMQITRQLCHGGDTSWPDRPNGKCYTTGSDHFSRRKATASATMRFKITAEKFYASVTNQTSWLLVPVNVWHCTPSLTLTLTITATVTLTHRMSRGLPGGRLSFLRS